MLSVLSNSSSLLALALKRIYHMDNCTVLVSSRATGQGRDLWRAPDQWSQFYNSLHDSLISICKDLY